MQGWFYLAGALPLVALGSLHLIYTLGDVARPRRFAPADSTLLAAMARTPLRITGETTMWRAWLGFNFSHSLGVLVVGVLIAWAALRAISGLPSALPALGPLYWAALGVAAAYAVLAWQYWFRVPLIGTLVSAACFAAGLVAGAV